MRTSVFEASEPLQPVHDYTADDLALWVAPVQSDMPCSAVIELLTHNPEFPGVAVVDGQERVLGLVNRTDFMTTLAKPFGREVYHRRPIRELMDPQPLVVDANEPINDIGRRIVQDVPKALENGFVITRDGTYVGLGTAVEFLRHEVDLVHRRTEQLEEARQQAVEASQAKSSFLANMSHEIRTPLNGVIANLELLKFGTLDLRQREMVDAADLAANALLQIVGDILDFSKIEAGRLEIEQIDMSPEQVVQEVRTLIASRASQANITLKCVVAPDVPEQVLGDPLRLRQILTNLAGNAIKFTDSGGVWLFVRVLSQGEHSATLRYEVSDTGVGFEPEKAMGLFEAFAQADSSTTRKFGGTGLGLAICKRLVALMGGNIANDGRPKGGASFYFDVPHVILSPADLPDRKALAGKQVAILSPDVQLCGRIEGFLTGFGAQPVSIRTAEEAVALLPHGHGMAATIVDMRMLGRETPALRPLLGSLKTFGRSILLSPLALDFSRRRQLLTFGFDHVIEPPFRGEMLLAWLVRLIAGPTRFQAGGKTVDLNSVAPWRGRARVLVLEDTPMNQMVVRRQFDTLGLAVTIAENGHEGLARVKAEPWDMVFSDIQMPGMDGFDFTRAVRAWESAEARTPLPIVAMTANALQGDAQKCLDAGMDDYLSKPVTIERLIAALLRWLPAAEGMAVVQPPPAATTLPPAVSPPIAVARPVTGQRAVDLAQFQQLLGTDDPAVTRDLLGFFLEAFPELLVALEAAALSNSPEALRSAAHTAKGAARNAAAVPLGEVLATLEHQAGSLSTDQIEEIMMETRARWKDTADFIQQFLTAEAS